MKYPTRLIADEGAAGKIARGILADPEMGAPPSTAMGAVWSGINAQLSRVPNPTIPHTSAAQSAGAGLGLLKVGAIATLIGGAGLTAVLVQPSEQAATRAATEPISSNSAMPLNSANDNTSPQATASAKSTDPVKPASTTTLARSNSVQPTLRQLHDPQPLAADEAEASLPSPEREGAQTRRPRAATASSASVGTFSDMDAVGEAPKAKPFATSQLLRETALLEEGRAALRAGDSSQAWKTLKQWGAEFPLAQLNQEREALTIELLWRSGRKELARGRIRAFVHDYPTSAHASRLRALLEP